MEEENAPGPEPLFVFVVNATVGFCAVLQTNPLAVTAALPPTITLPPPLAVVDVTPVIAVVVTVGRATCPIRDNKLKIKRKVKRPFKYFMVKNSFNE
jgi:hypothetical protein